MIYLKVATSPQTTNGCLPPRKVNYMSLNQVARVRGSKLDQHQDKSTYFNGLCNAFGIAIGCWQTLSQVYRCSLACEIVFPQIAGHQITECRRCSTSHVTHSVQDVGAFLMLL